MARAEEPVISPPDGGTGLGKDEIARVVRSHQPEVQACYERGLQKRPGITGKIVVTWRIEASGAVSKAVAEESQLGEPVDGCIVRNVRSWTFPKAGGATAVQFPFRFPVEKSQPMGSLDKEIIRKVIRGHLREVTEACLRHPSVIGGALIRFTIAGSGAVVSSVVERNTYGDPIIANCIADRFKTWTFPKPKGGGIVVVTYPFEVKTAGAE